MANIPINRQNIMVSLKAPWAAMTRTEDGEARLSKAMVLDLDTVLRHQVACIMVKARHSKATTLQRIDVLEAALELESALVSMRSFGRTKLTG
jgi:hypothetical protein